MNSRTRKSIKVWRYMSFGRFVWMLKTKSLWMCRADQLGDAWEMAFSKKEVESLRQPDEEPDDAETRRRVFRRFVRVERERTFVNCWTASNSESHAMWSIYCGSKEGIAVQTTLRKLKASVGSECHVLPVGYDKFKLGANPGGPLDLVARKRKPFAYEKERRIVWRAVMKGNPYSERIEQEEIRLGFGLPWDPELHVERVLIHPGADHATFVAVTAVVEELSPKLEQRVVPSAMAELPAT